MENLSIRKAAKSGGVKLWEVAERLEISDSNFSRKLRRKLTPEETARILSIIDVIAAERQRNGVNYEQTEDN